MASYCPKCGPGHGCICDPALSPSSAAPEYCTHARIFGQRSVRCAIDCGLPEKPITPSAAPDVAGIVPRLLHAMEEEDEIGMEILCNDAAAEIELLTRERDDAVYDASTTQAAHITTHAALDEAKELLRAAVVLETGWMANIDAWLTANEPAKGEP